MGLRIDASFALKGSRHSLWHTERYLGVKGWSTNQGYRCHAAGQLWPGFSSATWRVSCRKPLRYEMLYRSQTCRRPCAPGHVTLCRDTDTGFIHHGPMQQARASHLTPANPPLYP